jgi:hypothetical protein
MSNDFKLPENDRRQFTRIKRELPAELHQGGAIWEVQLIDISLNGFTVSRPDPWDADYSHPFRFILHLIDGTTFETYGRVIHIEPDCMGMRMEHLADAQIGPLARLLSKHVDDEVVERELRLLDEINR